MSDLQRWLMKALAAAQPNSADVQALTVAYTEQQIYTEAFSAQVEGLWRVH